MTMFRLSVCAAFLSGAIFAATASMAQQQADAPRQPPPAAFQKAVQCRTVQSPEERLACYDREIAALETAEATNEIRVVDRAQVQKTRRGLFGLVLPDINIFGGGKDDGSDPVDEINSSIRTFTQDPRGRYTFTLDDGARWQQLDTRVLNTPRAGQTVRIRRAAMGSFLANVNKQTAIRVKRVN
jgi:hypothetical protein